MLKQRIITALFLLPAVVYLLFMVQIDYFATIVLVIVYLMGLEWAKVSEHSSGMSRSFYALAVTVINLAVWYFSEHFLVWPSPSWPQLIQSDWPLIVLFATAIVLFLSFFIVLTFSKYNRWWTQKPIRELMGLIMLPGFFVSLICIRQVDYPVYGVGQFYFGGFLVLLMFLLVWAADVGAFVTGKLIGKTKLAKVSPNKTWEGVIGGVLLSVTIGWLTASALALPIGSPLLFSGVLLFLAIASVLGDLFESALKRVANIKDSGNILPGHGGLLDRLDSTIAVAPLYFLCFSYFGWFNG